MFVSAHGHGVTPGVPRGASGWPTEVARGPGGCQQKIEHLQDLLAGPLQRTAGVEECFAGLPASDEAERVLQGPTWGLHGGDFAYWPEFAGCAAVWGPSHRCAQSPSISHSSLASCASCVHRERLESALKLLVALAPAERYPLPQASRPTCECAAPTRRIEAAIEVSPPPIATLGRMYPLRNVTVEGLEGRPRVRSKSGSQPPS